MNEQIKHDFLNNSIRIEVIHRLISDQLDQKEVPHDSLREDLEKFLNLQLEYLKDL